MIRPHSPLTNPSPSDNIKKLKGRYRGVEQMVARRAHNPEVVRFKSHPRNQRKPLEQAVRAVFSFPRYLTENEYFPLISPQRRLFSSFRAFTAK